MLLDVGLFLLSGQNAYFLNVTVGDAGLKQLNYYSSSPSCFILLANSTEVTSSGTDNCEQLKVVSLVSRFPEFCGSRRLNTVIYMQSNKIHRVILVNTFIQHLC